MERREFIKKIFLRTGIGTGVLATGAGGLAGYYQPRKALYKGESQDEEGSEKLEIPRRAAVIGGGLAGVSAALELAEKGFDVTLVESSASLGGKLTGWNIDALGDTFPVEHGFHGFFDQYYNLNEIFAKGGVKQAVFNESPGYPVLFREFPAEIFGQTPKYFPFNVFSILGQSRRLDLISFLKNSKGLLSTLQLFEYDYSRVFRQYDNIDFMTFCRRGEILPAFVDTVLHPFADATMNRMEVLSAAEALRYFHFYFMGSPEGLAFRITNRDCMTALIDPLEARLRQLGVTIMKGCTARKIVAEGQKVNGVLLDRGSGGSGLFMQIKTSEVPASGFGSFLSPEGVPVLIGRRNGGYAVFDARCTHMGCPVSYDTSVAGFYCPCHSGRYDLAGVPLSGPPKESLAPLSVTEHGGTLIVRRSGGTGGEVLACDYCVVASNVSGTRSIFRNSDTVNPLFEKQISSLGEADPYAVYRVWLDRPLHSSHFPFYTTSGFTYTDSITIYSHFQEPFISWAKKNRGAVLELHAYAIAPEDIKPEEVVKATMLKEMRTMIPELAGANVLYGLFMQQSNFTRWAPGDHASRPGVETPYANLFLAGDWVKVDAPVFLMEAAVFTGRMAANAIFRNESLKPVPLPIVPMEGLFA
ncbi:MAG: FAD-dependent oxidoreductase [Chlorobiaceae bacterium]|nr:FAD-dependent oxidoreductase [Chlorobiaceae bacterium]